VPLVGLIIAHGVMMGIAWGLLAPAGACVTRFFKPFPTGQRQGQEHGFGLENSRGGEGEREGVNLRPIVVDMSQATRTRSMESTGRPGADFRHGKHDMKVLGLDAWFVAHVSMQVSALALTVMAFSIIAVAVGQGGGRHFGGGHGVLGLLVVSLSLLQGAMGALRPSKGGEWRDAFESAHGGLGWVTVCLGAVTISLGTARASVMSGE